MATDLFPEAEVGQCINEEDAVIKSFVAGGAITKGYPVKFSDNDVWPPEVVGVIYPHREWTQIVPEDMGQIVVYHNSTALSITP